VFDYDERRSAVIKTTKEIDKMGEHNCYGKNEAECIKKKAYELWEKDGHKNGNDLHYWLQAKKTVEAHTKK